MAENIYNWQYNTIPGNAKQGAVLMTRNNITQPPFNQTDFIWMAMEDIIGTADMKLEYDEVANLYKLYKAKGHRDNEGNWTYDWEFVGDWAALTEEVVETLRTLVHVDYVFETTGAPNSLTVYGIRKDGSRDLLCNISFASTQYVDTAVNSLQTQLNTTNQNLQNEITRSTNKDNELATNIQDEITRATNKESQIENALQAEVTRATNRENELAAMIQEATINPGVAIEVVGADNQVNVKYDNDSIKVNANNQLKADVFDDTQVSSTKGWSSAKITQQMTSAMTYEGQVATYEDLPSGLGTDDKGKTYNVVTTGDNYTWNGTGWDKLSGDYIEGNGITIQAKTIRAKGGNGIDVNANGINVTTGDTTQIVSDKVEVKPHNGLVNSADGVGINANFNIKTTPLGTESSKLAIYSDGKIGVDFETAPVKITADRLYTHNFTAGQQATIANIVIPNAELYDMFEIGAQGFTGYFTTVKNNHTTYNTTIRPATIDSGYKGVIAWLTSMENMNLGNGTIGRMSLYLQNPLNPSITSNWTLFTASAGSPVTFYINGLRAG